MSERVIHLPSGLTVAVEPMISTRSVSIGVWVGVGARDEPEEVAGISHFVEHLLFKGTTSRSATEISQAVDRVGGDLNAFTSKEYTAYYCRVPARHASLGVEMLGDVLTAPAMRDDDIVSERQVILEELAMDDDNPEDVVHRTFAHEVFPGHPLGRETAGGRATVRTLTPDDVRGYYTDRYRSGNTIVAIAGAVDPDEIVDQVSKAFDSMPDGDGRSEQSAPPNLVTSVGRSTWVQDDTEQVHMVIGGRALARTAPRREALDVVNHVLGGGLSSRLFDEIRERRGLAYSVFSTAAAFSDCGVWSVYAGSIPEHATEVRELIGLELERLVADGITHDELEIAIGYLCGAFEMGLEESSARMSRLGGQLLLLGELVSVEQQLERWMSVTLDDAHEVIRQVYGAARPVTVAVGPLAP